MKANAIVVVTLEMRFEVQIGNNTGKITRILTHTDNFVTLPPSNSNILEVKMILS